jgi:serine/threonine-protein kinase RsbW
VDADRLTIRIPNDLSAAAQVVLAVEDFCARNAVPAKAAYHVGLCIDEALTNTISYGYPEGGRHEIALELERRGEDILIELVDDGAAFNPLEAPEPDLDAPLEERPIGGLGVHMIRTFMTEAAYRREGGRNHLRLRKRFGQER